MSAAEKGDLTDARKLQGDKLSEAEAIERAKQGDAEAFQLLYGLHKRRVYSLCLRMTANTAEAEDLTQESFLQLFRKISTFRGESAFSTWLHRLAFNIVLMRLRRHSFQVLSLDEMLEPGEKTAGLLQKHIGSRDLRLAGSADRMDLERALEQLPPGYKAVFILHDVQGYQHREIAAIRGCTLGNSKSQLHKARARLQHLLRAGVRDNEHHIRENMEPVLDTVSAV